MQEALDFEDWVFHGNLPDEDDEPVNEKDSESN